VNQENSTRRGEPPASLAEWKAKIPELRATLWELLGNLPPVFIPSIDVLWTALRGNYTIEKLAFDNGAGALVSGYVLLPSTLSEPAPAVLYNHLHGFQME
jgi:hypothetical protein